MKRKAFTLIEILVVVGIIGILATLGTTSYTRAVKNGRDARRKSDISDIRRALEMYWTENNGNLPGSTSESYDSIATTLASQGYLSKKPDLVGDTSTYKYYYKITDNTSNSKKFVLCARVELPSNANTSTLYATTTSTCSGTTCYFCVTGI